MEQGTDRLGAEYARGNNDFGFRWLEYDNRVCGVCHGTGAKVEFRYVTRDYRSSKTKKICKNLQAHEHSVWLCPACIKSLNEKKSIIIEQNLKEPKPCPYCGGHAERKQLHFKPEEGEDLYKNEHHEDGSWKWSYLECNGCGRKTKAYCYEYQSTDLWNQGEAELIEDDK